MWFDPVSVAKAPRGVQNRPWHLAAPNWDELLAMLGWQHQQLSEWHEELPTAVLEAAAEALVPGFGFADNLLLTLGPRGCVLVQRNDAITMTGKPQVVQQVEFDVAGLLQVQDEPLQPLPHLSVEVVEQNHSGCIFQWYRLHALEHVRDVTGAGDALLAGTAAAFVGGWTLSNSIFLGLVCAHVTLFVDGSIAQELKPDVLHKMAQLLPQRFQQPGFSSRLWVVKEIGLPLTDSCPSVPAKVCLAWDGKASFRKEFASIALHSAVCWNRVCRERERERERERVGAKPKLLLCHGPSKKPLVSPRRKACWDENSRWTSPAKGNAEGRSVMKCGQSTCRIQRARLRENLRSVG